MQRYDNDMIYNTATGNYYTKLLCNIDREFEFYEFFSFLKFNEFNDFSVEKKFGKNS